MNLEEANKHYPLWKVEFGEFVYGKDSGTSYCDPENDIRRAGRITYYKKEKHGDEWLREYDERYGGYAYGAAKSVITLSRLQMLRKPSKDVVMFEWQDRMFKFGHYIHDQKAVCGDSILGDYYSDHSDDSSVKVDLVESIVFFYKRGTLVCNSGKLWLDGEMVMTMRELKDVHGLEWYQVTSMYPKHVKEKVRLLFPTATSYYSWSGMGGL